MPCGLGKEEMWRRTPEALLAQRTLSGGGAACLSVMFTLVIRSDGKQAETAFSLKNWVEKSCFAFSDKIYYI
jgi:hypothetical protein